MSSIASTRRSSGLLDFAFSGQLENLVPKPDPEVALLRGFDAEQDRKGAVDAWFGDVRENARRGAAKRAKAKW